MATEVKPWQHTCLPDGTERWTDGDYSVCSTGVRFEARRWYSSEENGDRGRWSVGPSTFTTLEEAMEACDHHAMHGIWP